MTITHCEDCGREIGSQSMTCTHCEETQRTSPFTRFTFFYFIAGFLFVVVYAFYADRDVATFVAANWLALGISVACIAYGLARKESNDLAGLIYIVGLAWLVLLLGIGVALIWNDGIGVQELKWLLS